MTKTPKLTRRLMPSDWSKLADRGLRAAVKATLAMMPLMAAMTRRCRAAKKGR